LENGPSFENGGLEFEALMGGSLAHLHEPFNDTRPSRERRAHAGRRAAPPSSPSTGAKPA